MTKPKYIELLAPAGSYEALEAAVRAGADAVYLGGKAFGARQYADNFDEQNLAQAVKFAHLHRVKIYVTVNTLVDDSEFQALAEYLLFLNNVHVDGIIVQDLGVVRLARQLVPELPLHASTQMTITNSLGVEFAKQQGMERAVLARELNLGEIKAAADTGTEIETFIHGALCVCYSGQCLMSSLIGGRSGNRGRCAQPCRLPYNLVDKNGKDMLENADAGQYLLSPRDLNTLEILPQLLETGVVSYKIEGRMKRPEYVAVVVDCYRRAIDSYLAGNYHVSDEDYANIRQIFNRDFTTAYLTNRPGRTMMSDRRPNNRGVLLGRVTKLKRASWPSLSGKGDRKAVDELATVKLDKDIHVGDGLEFWVTTGGRVGTVVEQILLAGEPVETAHAGQQVEIAVPKGVRLNDRVFRTLDSHLMAYANQFFGPEAQGRIPLTAKVEVHLGQPFVVVLTDDEGTVGRGESEFITEVAKKHALTKDSVKKQIDRLGTTEYELKNISYEIDDNVMVPVSEMNEARRMAVEDLERNRLAKFEPQRELRYQGLTPQSATLTAPLTGGQRGRKSCLPVRGGAEGGGVINQTKLSVHCDTLEKVNYALKAGADRVIFAGDAFTTKVITEADYRQAVALARGCGKEICFATPRIVKEEQLDFFRHLFGLWSELQPDYVYVNNNSLLTLAQEFPSLKLWGDHSLNIYNQHTLAGLAELGVAGATLSHELTMAQVGQLAQAGIVPLECLVQGRIEMMVSEYCAGGSFLGNLDKGACTFKCGKALFLKDRQQAVFPIATDQYCRTHILNSVDLSMAANVTEMQKLGVAWLRIDGRYYSAAEVGNYTNLYRSVLDGTKVVTENQEGTTRGHYFRGVL